MQFHFKLLAAKILIAPFTIAIASCGGGGGGASTITNPNASGLNISVVYKGTPGDFNKTITVGTASRRYLLHVPPSYRNDTAMPAVVLFHGGQGSATTIANITGKDTFSVFAGRAMAYWHRMRSGVQR